MLRVYQAADLLDAQLVLDDLNAAGIESVVQGGYLSGAIGELPADVTPSVWIVCDDDLQAARELLGRREQARRRVSTEWRCPQCGETLAGSFDSCWNCATARPRD